MGLGSEIGIRLAYNFFRDILSKSQFWSIFFLWNYVFFTKRKEKLIRKV